MTSIADLPAAQQMVLFDAFTRDDALRNEQCRKNVLHMLPSRAMRADALAQYMMKKRWTEWFLVIGPNPEDRLFADAVRRAAKRFGMKIVEEKTWEHTYDARRTAQSDVAVFTQVDDYDVLVVADEQGLFGEYLDYRTWHPRPVIGTQGLIATSWHRTHEQWGAVQIQNRFKEQAGRWMEEQDYAAYLAVRAIGEATTRTKSNELKPVKDYLLSEQFALQGYKGNPLSFRSWNGQLRQPILLAAPRSLVAVAPIEGFLHPKTELDTLGYDQSESTCK
jgi:ABC transporter substrate binding protein (PQQ-dependent alcohol dehydrogenase system)